MVVDSQRLWTGGAGTGATISVAVFLLGQVLLLLSRLHSSSPQGSSYSLIFSNHAVTHTLVWALYIAMWAKQVATSLQLQEEGDVEYKNWIEMKPMQHNEREL